MADADEDRRCAPLEPRGGLERGEHAADGPVGRELATIAEVAVDQPVTECRGPERMGLAAAADRDLGVKAAVGRSPEPRVGGQAHEPLDRSFVVLEIVDNSSFNEESGHGVSALTATPVPWAHGKDKKAASSTL